VQSIDEIEVAGSDRVEAAQNLERKGAAGKIFWDKELPVTFGAFVEWLRIAVTEPV
jgi:hypothetical protein